MTNLIFLKKAKRSYAESKNKILKDWLSYKTPKEILLQHDIAVDKFIEDYASGVFDYFMGVISDEMDIGNCPVIQSLLVYLKDREISADELFEICSHFRRSMIDFSYDAELNSKELFDEISYIFDKNFGGVLKHYTDTIFAKEQEINRNVKLVSEYKKALDESALIFKTDMDGNITYVNNKLLSLCESNEDEIIGQKFTYMNHTDVSIEEQEKTWLELQHNNIYRGTIKNKKKNGEYYYMDATIVKINDPHDNDTEYMSVAYDVTKLIDARLEALKASQAKEYFLSNMSHEIRTPLNAILGFVYLLSDEELSKKQRNYLEIILSSGENLLSIINDILDFSKLRSGEFTIEPKIFSLHEELSHTMELFVASANSKDITITSFIDPMIPRELYADALRIKQILSNFLSNAIKFTPVGGLISVIATCHDKRLRISVEDNGIGIAKSDINNIFTAFAQAQYTPLSNCDGTGLGLSICFQLSELMDGSTGVSSRIGEGSTFWMEIPIEIEDEQCLMFDDIQDFQKLKMVVYSPKEKTSFQHESFIKYANIFNMNIELVESLEYDYDVAIFVHEDMDKKTIEYIKGADKQYIALMSKQYDEYEKYEHINSMCFPLYCSKIHTAFSELVKPETFVPHPKHNSQKFIGHVLIAEDNEANQELIKILLSKYGLTYDLANNGLEAVELYKKNNYDLILMDEQMPVMDGNEAIKNILAIEALRGLRHTPVSALTANVIKGARERGLLSGFDAFLGKPIVVKELERVFLTYLKINSANTPVVSTLDFQDTIVEGLDTKKLSEELMLNDDELVMLLELFIKKMKKTLPELQEAIKSKDYEKIALMAHSIKGSSGNFRIEALQNYASEIEQMAKEENRLYDYNSIYEYIRQRVEEIKIV